MVDGTGLENRHTLTGIGGSNPSLSAIQSGLQRNCEAFLQKQAKDASISRYSIGKPDRRERIPTQAMPFHADFLCSPHR